MKIDKIIFIRYKKTPFGGAERYLERLNETLRAKGYKTEIINSKLPKLLPSWLRVLLFSFSVCRAKASSGVYLSLDRISCADIYRAGDGVHRAYLKIKGFSLNPLHLSYLWLERRVFKESKAIIANSKMVKDEILKYYPTTPESKIHIIYNGIPAPKKLDRELERLKLAKELKIDTSLPIILFVGSGFKRKGVDEFLEHISKLKSPFMALIVGKEKRLNRYKKRAKGLKIDNRVIFMGARRDVDRLYLASDIFLFPTHYEPFSNVVLEALSYQSVVFTTAQNGASEILPRDWVMDNPKDSSVVDKIDSLLQDESKLKAFKLKALNLSKAFSIEENTLKTLEVIKKVTS